MSYTRHVIFFALCVANYSFTMESNEQTRQRRPINIKPFHTPETHETSSSNYQERMSSEQKTHSLTFTEDDIKELKMVFKHSPTRAKNIVKRLTNPNFSTNYSCSSFFIGVPGSGKTSLAKAIAYKLQKKAQWENQFISSSEILGEHRNETAIQLNKILKTISASPKKQILIIDELNQLLEHSSSKNHDTDATSKTLWSFLDRQNKNRNFFFIGTMNSAENLPQPFKSRIAGQCIFFSCLTDKSLKNTIFRSKFSTQFAQLDNSIDDTYLTQQLDKLSTCTGRDLCNLATLAEDIYREYDQKSTIIIINKQHLAEAINEYINTLKQLKYEKIEETDEERQERFHKENLEAQEKHFVQQQMIQLELQHQTAGGYSLTGHRKEQVAALISDEQKQIFDDMMQSTRARTAAQNKGGWLW